MRVVIETEMEPHAPELYTAQSNAEGRDGFDACDAAARAAYARDGYLLIRNAFSPQQVAEARAELQAMAISDDPQCDSIYYEGAIRALLTDVSAPAPPDLHGHMALGETRENLPGLPAAARAPYIRKFMGFVEHHPPLSAIALAPTLVQLIESLLGEPATLFQDMAMIKPPQGREKPWHQDHAYFRYAIDTRIVAAWVALDEVTTQNGCMYLLPGQHTSGPQPHFMRRDWQLCDANVLGRAQVAVPMRAGDVLLFDAKLPHGTPTNRSDQFRWALQLHYRPLSAQPATDEERLAIFGGEGLGVSC